MFRVHLYLLLSLYIACVTLIPLKQTEEVINGVKTKSNKLYDKEHGHTFGHEHLTTNNSPLDNPCWELIQQGNLSRVG